jgi:hypothetical protein
MIRHLLGLAVPRWMLWTAAAALLAVVYGTGRIHQARSDLAERTADDLKRSQAVADRLVRRSEIAQRIGRALEGDLARNRKHQTAIETEVRNAVETRVLYRDCVLDADVVRHLNAALAGAPKTGTPGQPPDPVP